MSSSIESLPTLLLARLKRFLQRELETRIGRPLVAGDILDGATITIALEKGVLAIKQRIGPKIPKKESPACGSGGIPGQGSIDQDVPPGLLACDLTYWRKVTPSRSAFSERIFLAMCTCCKAGS